MPTPKVSILLPLYKVEAFIADCLRSILAQTRTDFEIVAIDDCSPDDSGEIARSLLAAQDAIAWKLVRNEKNVGIAETRRIAVSHARGDYVLCVDSDDFVAPNLLDVVCREADQHNADVVIFGATCIDPQGREVYRVLTHDAVMTGLQAVTHIFDLTMQAYCWNKLFRRELFASVDHPSGLIYEDIAVCVQALSRARVVRMIPDALYFYVKRENGLSVRFNPRIVDLFEIMDRVERDTHALPIDNYSKLFFRLKYVYAYRTIAFEAARQAPDYATAVPILDSVSSKLRFTHIGKMYADRRPRLSVAMCLLKIHPRIFYRFVRRFN
ncbi:glycosyltransferase family 2 protein [Caballeronia sp. Lep1P3]|uniref:glycosyltransferase family 2 protein n=1 Tax=Caballeronia sp. Lep1P3 TaxID=2878150 RepID=UPI001FD4662F|nr:glycosyltransferase family 2 protein [Caballeronia sp. Lep1P3]